MTKEKTGERAKSSVLSLSVSYPLEVKNKAE
jgi:hypothetical protein